MSQFNTLLLKEFKTDWRQKYTIFGILLYAVSTIFVCYQVFHTIGESATWNALLWIVLTFAAITSSTRLFILENQRRQMYLYTIANPRDVILARSLYQGISFMILSVVCFVLFSLFLGGRDMNLSFFLVTLLLGAFGMASVLTVTSSIAAKGKNASVLASILGLPLLLPIVLLVIQLSRSALANTLMADNWKNLVALGSMNILVYALAYLLFPYLWRD